MKCIFQFGNLSDLSGSDKRQRTDSMASSDQVFGVHVAPLYTRRPVLRIRDILVRIRILASY
jgi:hypothetical protein